MQDWQIKFCFFPTPRASSAMNENMESIRNRGKYNCKLEEAIAFLPTPMAQIYSIYNIRLHCIIPYVLFTRLIENQDSIGSDSIKMSAVSVSAVSVSAVSVSAVSVSAVSVSAVSVSAIDRKSTRLNSSHSRASRMPSSA